MARCGCGSGCNCLVQSALPNCLPVTGNGSIRLPYTVGLTLAPNTATVTNVLQCTSTGLLVDENSLNVAVNATNGIQGDGLAGSPLQAAYSTDAGNQAGPGGDGNIFVPFPAIVAQLPIQGDGQAGTPLNLLLSADAGNSATLGGDGGVFVPSGGAASVITTGCVIGNGLPGTPLDLDFNPNSSIQCGASGLELDLDGTNGGTSGLSDTAAGLRVAESPRGALKRSASGLSQLAWHTQFAWPANLTVVGTASGSHIFQANGIAPTTPINTVPAAFGSWNNALGRFDFTLDGMFLVSLSLLIPGNPTTVRGWNMAAQRGVTVAEGVGGTGLLDSTTGGPRHRLFTVEQRRVGYTFVMSFGSGNSMKPIWEVINFVNSVSMTVSATASLTYLGELQ